MSLGRRVVGLAAQALDRAAVSAVHLRSAKRHVEREGWSFETRLSLLERTRDAYAHGLAEGASFFPEPPRTPFKLERVRDLRSAPGAGDAGVFDATWTSEVSPWLPGLEGLVGTRHRNRTACARLFLGGKGRPVVICIHGYLGGHFMVEERKFPVNAFFRAGLDIALPVLPYHALRADPGAVSVPPFPSVDPRVTNEGFRQAISDLRALLRFFRARGAPAVGVIGTSLGGYVTALLATLDPELAFAVPIVPLSSVADFARDHGELGQGSEAARMHAAYEEANRVVSPFARPLAIDPSRTFVLGAEADRVTGMSQASRVAEHFNAPLETIAGGHLLQLWRGPLERRLLAMLAKDGLVRLP